MKDRIKQLRKQLGMTQQEFADRLGIRRNNVAKYETGENSPSEAVVSLICKTFNVNEDWLRNGTGEMFIQMDMEDQLMEWAGRVLSGRDPDFRKRFVKMLMSLTDDQWELLEQKALELVAEGYVRKKD